MGEKPYATNNGTFPEFYVLGSFEAIKPAGELRENPLLASAEVSPFVGFL
jgi:hypothetical protein